MLKTQQQQTILRERLRVAHSLYFMIHQNDHLGTTKGELTG